MMGKPKIKLLLIEDNPGDKRLIEEYFKRREGAAFELSHADNLQSGLNLVEKDQVEALLLDLSLPDSQGLETFAEVSRKAPHLPIIILSGTADEEMALRAVRDGAQDYFVKGQIEPNVLIRALTYAIERSWREREFEVIADLSVLLRKVMASREVVEVVLDHIRDLLSVDAAAIILQDAQGQVMHVQKAVGAWGSLTGKDFSVEGSISGEVLNSARPYVEEQVSESTDERLAPYKEAMPELNTFITVPLFMDDVSIGVMAIGDRNLMNDHDLRLIQTIANITASNIHRATLYEQTRQQLRRLNSLRTIDLAINTSLDLNITLEVFLDQVTAQLGVDAAGVLLLDNTRNLRYRAGRGFRSSMIQDTILRIGESDAGRAAQDRQLIATPNIEDAAHEDLARSEFVATEGFVSHYISPLEARGEMIGVLEVFTRQTLQADQDWLDFFATLSGQAAIAIQNARLYENLAVAKDDLEIAYDATLEGWVRALDLRDHETEGHTKRVTDMCLNLARAVRFPEAHVQQMWRGALLHDIGKMAIPDAILRKPGPLTDEEWELMHMHPEFARKLLAPISYLAGALDIPLYHHEKWDGRGYPSRLSGEQIPLSARVFAVVDVWDALTSDRPYRKAWSREKALDYIKGETGTHFDPNIVPVFLGMVGDGK